MPINGESIVGFSTRLSHTNLEEDPRWFFQKFGIRYPTFSLTTDEISKLSQLSMISTDTIAQMMSVETDDLVKVGAVDLYTSQLVKNRVRICPECVRDGNFHRLLWTIWPYAVCHDHRRFLIERCPDCQEDVGWTKGSYEHCECGCNLVAAQPERATADQVDAARRIYLGVTGHAAEAVRGLMPDVRAAAFRDIIQAALLVGRYQIDGLRGELKSGRVVNRSDIPELIGLGVSAFAGGDDDLDDALRRILRTLPRKRVKSNPTEILEPFYHYVVNAISDPGINEMFKRHLGGLTKNFRTYVVGRQPDAVPGDWISLKDFAASIDRKPSWVRAQLVRSGHLPVSKKSYKEVGIDSSFAEELSEQLLDCITLADAASILGISRIQLANFKGSVLDDLRRDIGRFGSVRREISRRKTESLVEKVRSGLPYRKQRASGELTLSGVLDCAQSHGVTQRLVLGVICSGLFRGTATSRPWGSLSDVLFDRDQSISIVQRIADQLRKHGRLSADYGLAA
jgi:hypothetical protein